MRRKPGYRTWGRSGAPAVLVWLIVTFLGSPLHAGEAEERIVEGLLTDFGPGFVSVDHKRYTVCSNVRYLDERGEAIEMDGLLEAKRVAITVRTTWTASGRGVCVAEVRIVPIILN